MSIAAAVLACILTGSLVYCLLVLLAMREYLAQPLPHAGESPEPLSILKPLAGCDDGLEENLRSFFGQSHPAFELIFAVRSQFDPAVEVVNRLRRHYPRIRAKLLITGEPPYANAKVFALARMLDAARYDLVILSDSDIRVDREFAARAAAEFADRNLHLATCPYRAIGGPGAWSALEAEGMNTEFLAGLLVARMMEGVRFAVGPTIVARKHAIESLGGMDRFKDYLAEDFVLGQTAADAGYGVALSRNVVEHRIGDEPWRVNAAHRLRWARSTRRSRPAGYCGQLFTNPLPLAIALLIVEPGWWPLAVCAIVLRTLSAARPARTILHMRVNWARLFAQDLLAFAFWVAGFFGSTIVWRGRRYRLHSDGTFTLAEIPVCLSRPHARTASDNSAPRSTHPTGPYSDVTGTDPTRPS